MKTLTVALLLVGLFVSAVINTFTQTPPGADWLRVQSDDGEFSVEVPGKYRFFFDDKGFSMSDSGRDLPVTKMEMLNSYINGTLISIERYYASKDALNRIYELEKSKKGLIKNTSETRPAGTKYRQIVVNTDQAYTIRQYFYTKDHIYVLTAVSRGGETPEMRRFLDGVAVQMKPPAAIRPDATTFSNLDHSKIEVQDLTGQPQVKPPPRSPPDQIKPDPTVKSIVIVGKPLASYTDTARAAGIAGTIVIRLDFGEDGFIPKVSFIRSLPKGLDRQALFAAMRIKFLPAEKDGVPIKVSKLLEYTFDIY